MKLDWMDAVFINFMFSVSLKYINPTTHYICQLCLHTYITKYVIHSKLFSFVMIKCCLFFITTKNIETPRPQSCQIIIVALSLGLNWNIDPHKNLTKFSDWSNCIHWKRKCVRENQILKCAILSKSAILFYSLML